MSNLMQDIKCFSHRYTLYLICILAIAQISCGEQTPFSDKKDASQQLSLWNDGKLKRQIIDFIKRDTNDIPVEDRIAVFDMDGTIVCESPLWLEMYCSVAKMNEDAINDPTLLKYPSYQYAQRLSKDPADQYVRDHWLTADANYIDSMIWKAFEGSNHDDYIDYCSQFLNSITNSDKGLLLADMFYAPMLQLIEYLQLNQYKVYIVSGSVQGLIYSIVPQKTSIHERECLVGTRQILKPVYTKDDTKFIIQKGIFLPKNNNNGKTNNIYSKIGKSPVFAFGNTTSDFDMLRYAITNKHKGVGFMLNHDDEREYVYPPYHGAPDPSWEKRLKSFGGEVVSMKDDFGVIWKK